MNKKLKIHDGDTPGKVFEVKLEYPKPKVVQMENNKLICPFCNKKLEPIGTSGQFQCGTWGCDASFNFIATRDVWEYIDRTRKALEIAIQYIKHTQSVEPFWFNSLANKTLNKIKTTLKQKE